MRYQQLQSIRMGESNRVMKVFSAEFRITVVDGMNFLSSGLYRWLTSNVKSVILRKIREKLTGMRLNYLVYL